MNAPEAPSKAGFPWGSLLIVILGFSLCIVALLKYTSESKKPDTSK